MAKILYSCRHYVKVAIKKLTNTLKKTHSVLSMSTVKISMMTDWIQYMHTFVSFVDQLADTV